MSYTPVTVEKFKGLRLDADPSELGWSGATSLENVEFDTNDSVRTRPGLDQIRVVTSADPVWLDWFRDLDFVMALSLGEVNAYTGIANPGSANLSTVPANLVHGANFAGRYYMSDISLDTLHYFDGAALGSGPALTDPKFMTVTPVSRRLVVVLGEDTVTFSDPGIATFPAGNSIELLADEGVSLRMAVTWRDGVYIFADDRFFVFYSESEDQTNEPIFNYRSVKAGVGAVGDYAACAARDGVYFVHADGVYRTTGGEPQLVSQALQPFFDERTNGIFTPTGPLVSPRIHAGDDLLYVWQQGQTGMFVMDFQTREWTYWVLGVAPWTLFPIPGDPRAFLFEDSTGLLHRFSPIYSDDNGAVIPSHYQSGFTQLAKGLPATVRRYEITGSGTLTHTLYGDQSVAAAWQGTAATSVTMGTAPAVARTYAHQSGRARDLAFRFSAASGEWMAERWAALISAVRSY